MSSKKLNRRDFLRMGALTAAGTALASCAPADPEVIRETVVVDREVEVLIDYYPRADECQVWVMDKGPKPKGFNGRRRDLANLGEVILDALQGPVVVNDNQVADLRFRRLLR